MSEKLTFEKTLGEHTLCARSTYARVLSYPIVTQSFHGRSMVVPRLSNCCSTIATEQQPS